MLAHLRKLVAGDEGERASAFALFAGLEARGLVNSYHVHELLKACSTDEERQALLLRVEKRGIVMSKRRSGPVSLGAPAAPDPTGTGDDAPAADADAAEKT